MNIMELGAIGELVGGVAVVASLLYVGFQVRQSNRLEKAESARAATRDYVGTLQWMDTSLFRRGSSDFAGLSGDDQMAFHNWLIAFFWIGQNEYALEQRDLADEEHARASLRIMAALIRTPGIGEWWGAAGSYAFEPAFSQHLERLATQLDSGPTIHDALPWLAADRAMQGGA